MPQRHDKPSRRHNELSREVLIRVDRGMRQCDIARELEVSRQCVHDCIARRSDDGTAEHGPGTFLSGVGTKFSANRIAIVAEILRGDRLADIAERYGMKEGSLRGIIRRAQRGEVGLPDLVAAYEQRRYKRAWDTRVAA